MVFSFVLVYVMLQKKTPNYTTGNIELQYQQNTESQYLDNLINSLSNVGQSGFWGLFRLFQRTQLSIKHPLLSGDLRISQSRRKRYSVFLRIRKSHIVVLNAFSIHLNIKASPERT